MKGDEKGWMHKEAISETLRGYKYHSLSCLIPTMATSVTMRERLLTGLSVRQWKHR